MYTDEPSSACLRLIQVTVLIQVAVLIQVTVF